MKTIVPAYEGRSYELKSGQFLRVTDIEGQQIADWIAIGADNHGEVLSGGETLNFEWGSRLKIGQCFWSSKRRPMFQIVADDTNGVHDMTHAPCSAEFYAHTMGDAKHPNCRDNLLGAVAPFGITEDSLPNTVNLFQNTLPGQDDGNTVTMPGSAQAGQSIVLKALIDCFGAVSSCSVDSDDDQYTGVNGAGPTPVSIEVLDSFEA